MYLHSKAVLAIKDITPEAIQQLNEQHLLILEATGWSEKDYEQILLNRINSEWD